jgi:hypothetical protein
MTQAVKKPLRFALLCSEHGLAAWQARSVHDLRASGMAELVGVVRGKASTGTAISDRSRRPFWAFIQRRLIRSQALCKGHDGMAGVPILDDADDLAVDFILNFSGLSAPAALRRAAAYGVWAYDHAGRGELCGVWETYNGKPVTTAALVSETDGDLSVVLRQGVFKTQPHALARTQNSVLFGGVEWPRQACADIVNGHAEYLHCAPTSLPTPAPAMPNFRQALNLLLRMGFSRVSRLLRALFCHPLWNIGVAAGPIESFFCKESRPAIDWLPEPADGTFIADPFALPSADGFTILFEDFYFRDNRGKIASVEFAAGRSAGTPKTVFELPFHMSYPYLFQHDGKTYCIPETHEAGEAALYEAVHFPIRWRKVTTLLRNFPACDSTVFQHEGRWWLFCTSYAADSNLKLFLFHAPSLFGPWTPHTGNPVKTDVTSSRPAGTPFVRDGMLYRPAQDCSVRYGGRLVINRVTRLTPTEFAEEQSAVVEPDSTGPYPSGLHTISACGSRTVVDGLRYTFRPRTFAANLVRLSRLALRHLLPARRRSTPRQAPAAAQTVAGQAL